MAFPALTVIANIEAYFQGLTFTSSTSVTDTEVNNWIVQATNIIYGAISDRYVSPITDPEDLKQLEALCDMYVLTNVKKTIGTNQANRISIGTVIPGIHDFLEFHSILQKYQLGELLLSNSQNIGTKNKLKSNSFNAENNIETVTIKDVDQW